MTAGLRILDRGGTVLILEKSSTPGGNSNKASSGVNACCLREESSNNDTLSIFFEDTAKSAGQVADFELIETLVGQSEASLRWIQERTGLKLTSLVQLGGHSRRRTHRPPKGFVGAEIMSTLEALVRKYVALGQAEIRLKSKVSSILHDDNGNVMGVRVERDDGILQQVRANHVVLATGGFAADRSSGSLLDLHRPDLLSMPTTAGDFSTGDGIHLAESLGASTRDMDKVQLHPTGFVDPTDPMGGTKVLAAELLRGHGGILVNAEGQRFCNELGTRAYVSDKMLQHDPEYRRSGKLQASKALPKFYMILSSRAAHAAEKHTALYLHRGLMQKVEVVERLSEFLQVSPRTLNATLNEYKEASVNNFDKFGRVVFENVFDGDLTQEYFFVGEVTPVVHYCMGGLRITATGEVLDSNDAVIPGLHAAGEVTGGVHGNNRLGGNSLLECIVFGSIIGQRIPIGNAIGLHPRLRATHHEADKSKKIRDVRLQELETHSNGEDCWVAIEDKVFDLSTFSVEHPGGENSILSLCGTDGSSTFALVHTENILSHVDERLVGRLTRDRPVQHHQDTKTPRAITVSEFQEHSKPTDCWVAIHGQVYDLTEFSKIHPGGSYLIQKFAGKDATATFSVFHPPEKLEPFGQFLVGNLETQTQHSMVE